MPRLLAPAVQERICEARRKTGWGARQLAGALRRPHATVSKTLKRNGCSRREGPVREPANSYEWPCPGDLLHMDSTLTERPLAFFAHHGIQAKGLDYRPSLFARRPYSLRLRHETKAPRPSTTPAIVAASS